MGEARVRTFRSTRTTAVLLAVIVAVMIFWVLRVTYIVTMPLAFAFFVAMAIRPIQTRLNARLPRWLHWLSLTLALLAAVAAVAILVVLIWFGITMLSDKVPEYTERFKELWRGIADWARAHGLPLSESIHSQDLRERAVGLLAGIVASFSSVLAVLALIFFYTLLMLLEFADWQEKVERAFPNRKADAVVKAIDVAAYRIQRYLVARTLASALAAAVEGGWLWLMGVDGAFLWTVLIFLGNYVPNIGTTLSFIPPSAVAVLQYGWGRGFLVIGGMIFFDQIINSYITPVWFGRALKVSPLIILLALVFWSWLWGVAGALLAIPMTLAIVIFCGHVDALKGIAVLLAGTAEEDAASKEVEKGKPGRSGV